jgi:hypothetical protein
MDITCSHVRNPLLGWDITATAKAAPGEKIVRAQILVNDFPEYDESYNPPISGWQEQLPQKGDFPGDNTVRVVVTNDKGEDTEFVDSWSQ